MKRGNLRNLLVGLMVVSMLALAVNAFAARGRGYGPGWQRGGYGYNCPYDRLNATEEELTKMDQERQAFFKETEGLRTQIGDRKIELRRELAKESPDAAKASEIQKTLSDLYGQFDQKRLDHMIRMRQINPDAGRGYMTGRGDMRGPMMGRGPGRGGFGPGHKGRGMGW